jgi:CRISPR/Cas system CSM-associated protein Csm3 (group 7 of RAMP superfamily)
MARMTLKFEFLSYWHCSSGKGDGPGADLLAIRDASGLPYIPGKTVKGLLRNAVDWLDELESGEERIDTATDMFGTAIPSDGKERVSTLEGFRHRTMAGRLRIDSAELGHDVTQRRQWRAWAMSDVGKRQIQFLATTVASTRMNGDGVADDGSLRMVEVIVPLTLYADVESDAQSDLNRIGDALPLLREMGTGRNRGYGRVMVSVAY